MRSGDPKQRLWLDSEAVARIYKFCHISWKEHCQQKHHESKHFSVSLILLFVDVDISVYTILLMSGVLYQIDKQTQWGANQPSTVTLTVHAHWGLKIIILDDNEVFITKHLKHSLHKMWHTVPCTLSCIEDKILSSPLNSHLLAP